MYTTQSFISIKTFFCSQVILVIKHQNACYTYVAEPSWCKHSMFSRCLRALLADLQKRWDPPEIEVVTVGDPIQFCHSSPMTGSFNCKTVLIIEMSISVTVCLKCTLKFRKIQNSLMLSLKHDLPKNLFFFFFFFFFFCFFFFLKTLPFIDRKPI